MDGELRRFTSEDIISGYQTLAMGMSGNWLGCLAFGEHVSLEPHVKGDSISMSL